MGFASCGIVLRLRSPIFTAKATGHVGEDEMQLSSADVGVCGAAPVLEGQSLDEAIQSNPGILIVANPQMRCTVAAVTALDTKGVKYTLKEFQTPFQYTQGASSIWDWLHCSYPDDKYAGTSCIPMCSKVRLLR